MFKTRKFEGLSPWTYPLMSLEEHADALTVIKRNGANSLMGKTALITGASSGIGVETARALASAGARLFVLVRQVEKTKPIMDRIAAEFPDNGGFEIVKCELDSLESVNEAANEVLKRTKQLNILINNAGVMNTPFELTKDGFESQLAVCHLSHFLLFKKLQPLLLSSSTSQFNSRVVVLTSVAHNWGQVDFQDLNFTNDRKYDGWSSYGQAKTANIWFANHIESLYGSKGLHAMSAHPGGIETELQRTTPKTDFQKMGWFTEHGEYVFDCVWKTPEQGAATSVWAATASELEGKGALYLQDLEIAKQSNDDVVGYSAWAFDEQGATKLWDWSEQAVKQFIKD
jgi:NAD(P)-dependent dehydrogenase (short-subunit alcohol dehydrogenase family)